MPRTSTIERHPKRAEIERALVAPESSLRNIAERFGTSVTALHRHRATRMPEKVAKAVEAGAVEVVRAGRSLVDDITELQTRTMALLDRAEEAGDIRAALGAIREARENVKTIGLLMGEMPEPSINLTWNVVHVRA